MENVAEVLDEQSIIELALENFAALIDGAEFGAELEMMGIGRLQFLRRKQMLVELKGLYIALWRLALGRSFPDDADPMLTVFLRRYLRAHPDKIAPRVAERAREYWAMIQPRGDSDFNDIARHLSSFFIKDQQDTRAVTLKLALQIRRAYRFIFERLI